MFLRNFFWAISAALMSLGTIGVVVVVGYVYNLSKGLPDYAQLDNYKLPTVTRFYSSDQVLLGEYAYENRLYVPISAIPRRLINAFLAAEDRHFYEDKVGLDFVGIARAAIHNILNRESGKLEGGSTITQQVVKNLLLTNEKTIERKIREMIIAYRITKIFSKDKIMELYLNKIYLGNGSYGIASAALKYFNKSINELSLAEEALLAALPRAPSRLDPTKNTRHITERRNWVIQRMVESGFIRPEEALEVKFQPVVLDTSYSEKKVKADFFSEEVRKDLIARYGADVLYKGGLFIKTTLISEYQDLANKALSRVLLDYDIAKGWRGSLGNIDVSGNWLKSLKKVPDPSGMKHWKLGAVLRFIDQDNAQVGTKAGQIINVNNVTWASGIKVGDLVLLEQFTNKGGFIRQVPQINGAVVIMDVHSGKVLALVGGYDYEISKFNVAIQAMRQPGSLIKPFVFAAGLEFGMNNTSLIMDERLEIFQGPFLPLWAPKNYEKKFFGNTTLRQGFEFSRNIVSLQIAKLIGLQRIHELTKRFGLYHDSSFNNMSYVLGASEVNLLQITTAYAMIANGGFKVSPYSVEFIQDRDGRVIYQHESKKICIGCDVLIGGRPKMQEERERVMDDIVAYQLTSLLEGAVARGTGRGLKSLEMVIGGKTGTSNESKDAWYVGVTPDIVIGVYLGFDRPRTLGKGFTGGRIALPVFRDIVKEIGKKTPLRPFKVPENVQFVKIDYKTGALAQPGLDPKDVITEVLPMNIKPRAHDFDANIVNQLSVHHYSPIKKTDPESLEGQEKQDGDGRDIPAQLLPPELEEEVRAVIQEMEDGDD